MNTFRIIYRIILTGEWMKETVKCNSKQTARTAVIEANGDQDIKIISITAI